jgi:hypothetical protein
MIGSPLLEKMDQTRFDIFGSSATASWFGKL